jgi:murein tripeptide amidase MpaA
MTIENAAGAAYADGWPDYQAVASYDRENWFRVSTMYKEGELTLQHIPESDSVYYAYFAPYSYERHQTLVSTAAAHDDVSLEVIGQTCDGRDLDLLTIGEAGTDKKNIWIYARQHPGESMAEWLVEGVLNRLLDDTDALSQALLSKAVFYIMPNVNPDGSIRGHLRCNAAGRNLNREWDNPCPDNSPEIYHLKAKMDEYGVDFALDCHGDEALPYNFIASFDGIPNLDAGKLETSYQYQRALMSINPDFQMDKGYDIDLAGTANLALSTNQVAHRYGAVAMTLEMPFKDTELNPNTETGWSPERSIKLGYSCIDALALIFNKL